jgi:CheY-like chemotaxis protein
VAGVANLFRANAAAKGLSLDLAIEPEVPDWVLGDAQRLKQVLLNLVGNAIKFTDSGRVELHMAALPAPDGMACVRFDVLDSGIGIDAHAITDLFQPFHQGNATGKRRYGGTGLGLAISQRIVQAMGSRIDVHSRAGVGSRFGFAMEFPLDQADAPRQTTDSALGGLDGPMQLSGRVLLVEDNPVNRMIAVQMLQKLGAQVLEVHDGQQAVQTLERQRVDLVLMDCQMPVMDGYAATQEIREYERRAGLSRVPIVAMTAETFETDLRRAEQAGMDGHLAKPYTLNALRQVLQAWL